jgi:hypothetical protein
MIVKKICTNIKITSNLSVTFYFETNNIFQVNIPSFPNFNSIRYNQIPTRSSKKSKQQRSKSSEMINKNEKRTSRILCQKQ